MLRLTTNVAGLPASSARSSSAATRISSITSGRVSAKSAVSSSSVSSSPSRAPARSLAAQAPVRAAPPLARPDPRARNEAPVLELDHVQHPLLHPLRLQVLRVDAKPLRQRVALRREPLAHLMRARERLLGRDVVAVGREPAEVGCARPRPARPTSPTRFGGIWIPTSGISRLHSRDQALHVVDVPSRPSPGSGSVVARAAQSSPRPQQRRLGRSGLVGDIARPRAVVSRMRDEVLEDHLLDVAVALVRRRRAPRARRPAPPRSRRSRRGSRS